MFVRAASKLTEAEIQNNFVILLHCFHFLTKRSFVYTPSPEAEPINIGRTKNKDRTKDKWDTIPSSGTACASSCSSLTALTPLGFYIRAEALLTEGIVKKDVKVQEVVGEGYVPPIRVALPFPVRLTASVSSQWIWPRLHG